jgi:hypothetical protein
VIRFGRQLNQFRSFDSPIQLVICDYAPEPNPETKKKDVVWFALNDEMEQGGFGDQYAANMKRE